MGGIILPTSELCGLERDIEDLATRAYGGRIELKWHMPRASLARLTPGFTQSRVREQVFRIIAAHRGVSVVTLIYDVRGENSAVGRDRMRSYAFQPCLQRLQNHVHQLNDEGPHSVIIDTPPDGPKQLHAAYAVVYRTAPRLPSGKTIRSGKDSGFVSALHISDATHYLALQAADMSVGCVVSWAKAEVTSLASKGQETRALTFGRTHMAQWLHIARKGPNGAVLGYGLVRWPREVSQLTLATDSGLAELA